MSLTKSEVAQSFSRAAISYDAAAFLQAEVASRLLERLDMMRLKVARAIDIGCGTGATTSLLAKKFSKAKITGIDLAPGMVDYAKGKKKLFAKIDYQVADADELPFASNRFDLVFSNLTLQWMPDLNQTFKELSRVLKPDGLLIFSTLGPDTLTELRQSWNKVDPQIHVNDFVDMHLVGDAVFNVGFENTVMDRDVITLTYQTVKGLMGDLKAIGAHNVNQERPRGMLGKHKLQQLEAAYEAFRWPGGELPATYEVVFGHAWKKTGAAKMDYHTYAVDLGQSDANLNEEGIREPTRQATKK